MIGAREAFNDPFPACAFRKNRAEVLVSQATVTLEWRLPLSL